MLPLFEDAMTKLHDAKQRSRAVKLKTDRVYHAKMKLEMAKNRGSLASDFSFSNRLVK